MRLTIAVLALLMQGCFTNIDSVRARRYTSWSAEECMAIIMDNAQHNFRSDGNVLVVATPITPDVVQAIGRMRQLKEDVPDSMTREFIKNLTKDGTGIFVDDSGRHYNKQARPHDGRLDSLMVMLSLTNRTYPCDPPKINGIPLLRMSDVPCISPDISHLKEEVYLRVGDGKKYPPKYIYGQQNKTLTTDEHMLLMFEFNDGVTNLDSLILYLSEAITETGRPIHFKFNSKGFSR